MDNNPDKAVQSRQWEDNTLAHYVLLRNGVPLGDARSLRNMLHRSLGAGSFAGFWQYWNPIWSYALGKYAYFPLRQVLPSIAAYVVTFAISGAIHDGVIIVLRGSLTFLFTPWFILMSVAAVVGRALGMNLEKRPWSLRAAVNLTYILLCLVLTLAGKQLLGLP